MVKYFKKIILGKKGNSDEKDSLLSNSGVIGSDDDQENNDVNQKEKVEGKTAPANDEQNQKEKRIVPYKASEDKKDVNTDQKQALSDNSDDDLIERKELYEKYLENLRDAEVGGTGEERINKKIVIRDSLIQGKEGLKKNKTSKGKSLYRKYEKTIEKLNNELIEDISKEIDKNVEYYENNKTDKKIEEATNERILKFRSELVICLQQKNKTLAKNSIRFFTKSKRKKVNKKILRLKYDVNVNKLSYIKQENNANDEDQLQNSLAKVDCEEQKNNGQQINYNITINQNNEDVNKRLDNFAKTLSKNLKQVIKASGQIAETSRQNTNQIVNAINNNTNAVKTTAGKIEENTEKIEENLKKTVVIQEQQQQLADGQSEILKKVDETKDLREDKKKLEKEKKELEEDNLFFKEAYAEQAKDLEERDVEIEKLKKEQELFENLNNESLNNEIGEEIEEEQEVC